MHDYTVTKWLTDPDIFSPFSFKVSELSFQVFHCFVQSLKPLLAFIFSTHLRKDAECMGFFLHIEHTVLMGRSHIEHTVLMVLCIQVTYSIGIYSEVCSLEKSPHRNLGPAQLNRRRDSVNQGTLLKQVASLLLHPLRPVDPQKDHNIKLIRFKHWPLKPLGRVKGT